MSGSYSASPGPAVINTEETRHPTFWWSVFIFQRYVSTGFNCKGYRSAPLFFIVSWTKLSFACVMIFQCYTLWRMINQPCLKLFGRNALHYQFSLHLHCFMPNICYMFILTYYIISIILCHHRILSFESFSINYIYSVISISRFHLINKPQSYHARMGTRKLLVETK
jgi:hypothetical protein